MTKDQFIYALTACGCLLKDGKTWYEHNELIECFENLGLFEQEPFINKPCVSSGVCEHDKNKALDKIRADIEEYKSRQLTLAIGVADLEEGKQIALEYVLAVVDKYKAETEG